MGQISSNNIMVRNPAAAPSESPLATRCAEGALAATLMAWPSQALYRLASTSKDAKYCPRRLKVALKLKLEDEKTMDQLRKESADAWKSADVAKAKQEAAQKLVINLQDELAGLKLNTKELKGKEVGAVRQLQ